MLKRGFLTIIACSLCAFAYAASPFYTAWTIRSAAKEGQVAYLAKKIDWAAIKPGLKVSLTDLALKPKGTQQANATRLQPGLWQRIKSYSTRVFIHTFVDRYANPDGFETLVTYGRMIKGKQKSDDHLPLSQRIANVWSRVRRAAFTSLTRFEMDMIDKDDKNRMYCGIFEFKGWEWKLTDLRIRRLPTAQIAQLASSITRN